VKHHRRTFRQADASGAVRFPVNTEEEVSPTHAHTEPVTSPTPFHAAAMVAPSDPNDRQFFVTRSSLHY